MSLQRHNKARYTKYMLEELHVQSEEEKEGKKAAVEFMRMGFNFGQMQATLKRMKLYGEIYEHLLHFRLEEAVQAQSELKASLQEALDGHMFGEIEDRIKMIGLSLTDGDRPLIDQDDRTAVKLGEDMKYVDRVIGNDIDYLRAVRQMCPLCL